MEKKKTENQSIAADALRCRVGSAESGQHRERRQREHERAVAAAHRHPRREQRRGAGERHGQVLAEEPVPPLPDGPQRKDPGRPRKPRQQPDEPEGEACAVQVAEPVGPGAEGGRGQHREHPADAERDHQATLGRDLRPPGHDDADDGEQGRDARRAAGRERRQGQHDGERPASRPQGDRGDTVEEQRDGGELGQLRRRLVPELQQPERGDEGERRAVGDGPRVVDRPRFAAEGEGQRLRRFRTREVVGGVPGQGERQRQQGGERDARRERGVEPGRGQLDEDGTDPVGQQGTVGRQAADGRREPRRPALGDVDDVAERGDVGALPGVPSEQAGQHVGGAHQQQRDTRQRLGLAVADERGVGGVQGSIRERTRDDAARGDRFCTVQSRIDAAPELTQAKTVIGSAMKKAARRLPRQGPRRRPISWP